MDTEARLVEAASIVDRLDLTGESTGVGADAVEWIKKSIDRVQSSGCPFHDGISICISNFLFVFFVPRRASDQPLFRVDRDSGVKKPCRMRPSSATCVQCSVFL
jgi:hypothetical protein